MITKEDGVTTLWNDATPICWDRDDAAKLKTNAAARKAAPVATGVLDYFPQAIFAIAECSLVGHQQHNPGTPICWDRAKSGDESDALLRHFMERGTIDSDGIRHTTKVAWRALAMLQKELEDAARNPA